jgi:hypothetical protein
VMDIEGERFQLKVVNQVELEEKDMIHMEV